jgi:membrane protein
MASGAEMKEREMNVGRLPGLFRAAFNEWLEDKAPRLGAALAYYTIFSISPLLVIVIAIAGLVLGQEAVQGQVVGTIQGLVGVNGARAIQDMIAGAHNQQRGVIATVIGIVTLLIGASGVIGQLQDALNTIWEVKPKPGNGILTMVKARIGSITIVLGTGFLLLVSLIISAAVAALGKFLSNALPGGQTLWQGINMLLSLGTVSFMFAMLFRYVPDVKISWGNVWFGAVVTALLFTIGQFLLGLYLGKRSIGSAYGAAGSLVIVLVWVYYTSQILLFGAEFTQVYTKRRQGSVAPKDHAEQVTEAARLNEGMTRRG